MTTAQLSQAAIDVLFRDGAALGIRPPVVTSSGDPRTCEWTPDLSAAEQSVLAFIQSAAKAAVTITPAERQALEPFLATGRLFVGQSQSQFMALTAAERDRMLFDNVTGIWRVLFRLLRDS